LKGANRGVELKNSDPHRGDCSRPSAERQPVVLAPRLQLHTRS
jgi:hypothetical protein